MLKIKSYTNCLAPTSKDILGCINIRHMEKMFGFIKWASGDNLLQEASRETSVGII